MSDWDQAFDPDAQQPVEIAHSKFYLGPQGFYLWQVDGPDGSPTHSEMLTQELGEDPYSSDYQRQCYGWVDTSIYEDGHSVSDIRPWRLSPPELQAHAVELAAEEMKKQHPDGIIESGGKRISATSSQHYAQRDWYASWLKQAELEWNPNDGYNVGFEDGWKYIYTPEKNFHMWPVTHGAPHHTEKTRELGLDDNCLFGGDFHSGVVAQNGQITNLTGDPESVWRRPVNRDDEVRDRVQQWLLENGHEDMVAMKPPEQDEGWEAFAATEPFGQEPPQPTPAPESIVNDFEPFLTGNEQNRPAWWKWLHNRRTNQFAMWHSGESYPEVYDKIDANAYQPINGNREKSRNLSLHHGDVANALYGPMGWYGINEAEDKDTPLGHMGFDYGFYSGDSGRFDDGKPGNDLADQWYKQKYGQPEQKPDEGWDAFAKTAASQVMYHVAPTEARKSIQQYGLSNDRMPNPDADRGGPGAYLWDNIDNAQRYQRMYGGDLYEVNHRGLDVEPDSYFEPDYRPDYWQYLRPENQQAIIEKAQQNRDQWMRGDQPPGAWQVRDAIPPERIRLVNPPEKFTVPGQQLPMEGMPSRTEAKTASMLGARLRKLIQDLPSTGGFSLTQGYGPANGQAYFVAEYGHERAMPLAKATPAMLAEVRDQAKALGPDRLVGVWYNSEDHLVYFDVAQALLDLDHATKLAEQNQQLAIWDGFNQRELRWDGAKYAMTDFPGKLKAMFTNIVSLPGFEDWQPDLEDQKVEEAEAEDPESKRGWGWLSPQPQLQFAKTAALDPKAMYHGTRTPHEAITQHGLILNAPQNIIGAQADGYEMTPRVYLTTTPEDAADWAGPEGHVWQVNAEGLPLQSDPYSYNINGNDDNYFVEQAINPSRLHYHGPASQWHWKTQGTTPADPGWTAKTAAMQKWLYLNGRVMFHDHPWFAAHQLGIETGMKPTDAQQVSNWIATGNHPRGLGVDVAMGTMLHGKPAIWFSTVSRNDVYDAVMDELNKTNRTASDDWAEFDEPQQTPDYHPDDIINPENFQPRGKQDRIPWLLGEDGYIYIGQPDMTHGDVESQYGIRAKRGVNNVSSVA